MRNILRFIFAFSSLFHIMGCTTLTALEKKSVRPYHFIPVSTAEDFIWGINGHPATALDYATGDLTQEIRLLKEHQFDMYRVDVRTDSIGNVVWFPERFEELLAISVEEQIDILPVLIFDQFIKEYTLSPAEAYSLGKKQTQGFVKKYGSYFDYYELGNEQERKIIYPNVNGILMSDYDQIKFEIVASYLRGMIEEIKINDPSAKLMVSASWLHWGFFDLLENADINFDIISYHWYSNMGSLFNSKYENVNIINTLTKRYNKPVWITELNKKDGSIYETEEEQAYWVDYFIQELDGQSNIKAFFIYELYDEPNLINQSWAGEGEANYGIVKWKYTPKENSIEYKPVSDVLKFRIEEINYGYEDFISSLKKHFKIEKKDSIYEKLSIKLEKLKSKEFIVDQFLSESSELISNKNFKQESETWVTINSTYNQLLNRNPTQNEIKYWSKKIKRKNNRLIKSILLSEEYWENAIWNGYQKRTGYPRP